MVARYLPHPFVSFLVQLQRWWFLVLLFAIPIALKYVTKEPFAISWLNVLSVGFIGLGGFNLITGVLPFRKTTHKPFLWLITGLLLVMGFALLFTDPLRNGIGLWTSRLTQPLLVGFFGYQLVANKKMTISDGVAALFWSLVPLIILGGFQAIGLIEYRDPGRITGPYFYPNTFARYMDILLLVTLPWIAFSKVKPKWVYIGIWLLGVALLLSSKSYNGTVSLAVGLMMMLALLPQSLVAIKRIGIVSIIIVGLLVAINAPKLPKWQTSITDSRLTRLEFWQVASGVIKDNFWTGIGIKTWEKEYPKFVEKYGPFPPLNWGSVQPHNVFLDSMLKAGMPGLLAISALLFWPIFEGMAFVRSYVRKNKEWWFGLSMAGYGAAMLFFGLIDDPIWSDDTMPVLFVLYFMLAWVVSRDMKKRAA